MDKTAGIYTIKNSENDKLYIGSSIHLSRRKKEHFNLLKRGTHYNSHLQNSYNKNPKVFTFSVLEYCEKENLLEREQNYLDAFLSYESNKGYNFSNKASNGGVGKYNSSAVSGKFINPEGNVITTECI